MNTNQNSRSIEAELIVQRALIRFLLSSQSENDLQSLQGRLFKKTDIPDNSDPEFKTLLESKAKEYLNNAIEESILKAG